jgi:phage terminase large subunit GpA-like protein
VFAFSRPRARNRIYASRGATTLGKPIIGRRAKREGNPPAKVWELGTNEAKDIIYQRLEIDHPDAQGFQHFPKLGQFSEQYFAMLVAEDSEMKRAGDGKFYRAFCCEQGIRNEALDARVGTMAAERIRKPNYGKLAAELAVVCPEPRKLSGSKACPERQPNGDPASNPPIENQKSRHGGQATIENPKRYIVRGSRLIRRGGFVRGWR